MTKLTVDKVLVYRSEDGSFTRYEILINDQNPAENVDSIHVYREKLVDGDRSWVRTPDKISLDHLGARSSGGFQRSIEPYMRASRDVSSAVDECNKHWSKNYK
ncbi:hypothetical protein ACCX84_03705 [Pantoea trifolii]|uniref:hypothetical protein n=1 Tax=Pantoea trifolii TaxID=2968030 RepID=UPI003ED9D4C9